MKKLTTTIFKIQAVRTETILSLQSEENRLSQSIIELTESPIGTYLIIRTQSGFDILVKEGTNTIKKIRIQKTTNGELKFSDTRRLDSYSSIADLINRNREQFQKPLENVIPKIKIQQEQSSTFLTTLNSLPSSAKPTSRRNNHNRINEICHQIDLLRKAISLPEHKFNFRINKIQDNEFNTKTGITKNKSEENDLTFKDLYEYLYTYMFQNIQTYLEDPPEPTTHSDESVDSLLNTLEHMTQDLKKQISKQGAILDEDNPTFTTLKLFYTISTELQSHTNKNSLKKRLSIHQK